VFTSTDVRNSDNWHHAAVLTASDGTASDFFGNSVQMPNQNTIVVGAFGDDDVVGTTNAGSVYIFTGYGSNWTQTQKINYSGSSTNAGFSKGPHSLAATQKEIFIGSEYVPSDEKVIRYRI
jgi:hypothetical protein